MKLHLTHEMRKVPFVENGQEVCVCVSGYHEYAGVSRDQKRASEPLELERQMVGLPYGTWKLNLCPLEEQTENEIWKTRIHHHKL